MLLRTSALLAFASLPAAALGQTSSPIDRERIDRAPPSATEASTTLAPPAAAVRVDAGSETAPSIRNILFEGAAVPLVVAKAANDFVGRPASQVNLQSLAAAMSEAYARSPVALFTIVVPEQDLSSGDVRVLVGEGHVEAVVLTGEVDGRQLRLVRRYADRLTRERPTNRATLERYLSLIQDIPGLEVKSQLQMGEGPGGIRLILELDYQRPRLSFAFDNRTSRLIDDGQFQATARAYQLFREADETQLTGVASVNLSDLLFIGLSHSTPLNWSGTRLSLNAGFLRTRPAGTEQSGEARSAGLSVSHPLIRSYRRNLTLTVAADVLDSENAAFGSLLSTERLRTLRAGASYAQVSERRNVTGGLTVSKGIDMFDAHVPAAIGDPTFLKVNGRGSLDQVVGKRGVMRLRASGQWTSDPLPAVERFAIGGASYGRGFEVGLVNADRGVAALAELAWRPVRAGKFSPSELYGFADYAVARLFKRPGFRGQSFDLASAGAGVRLGWTDKAMVEVEFAHVLDRPFPGYEKDWRLSVSWRLNVRP